MLGRDLVKDFVVAPGRNYNVEVRHYSDFIGSQMHLLERETRIDLTAGGQHRGLQPGTR